MRLYSASRATEVTERSKILNWMEPGGSRAARFHHEDACSRFHRNVGMNVPGYTLSHSRRPRYFFFCEFLFFIYKLLLASCSTLASFRLLHVSAVYYSHHALLAVFCWFEFTICVKRKSLWTETLLRPHAIVTIIFVAVKKTLWFQMFIEFCLLTLAFYVHRNGHAGRNSACEHLRKHLPNALAYHVVCALLFKYWLCGRTQHMWPKQFLRRSPKQAGKVRGGWRRMSKDIAITRATRALNAYEIELPVIGA